MNVCSLAIAKTPQRRMAEFLKWVRQFGKKKMLYRGISRASCDVTASLQRRFEQKNPQALIPHDLFVTKTAALVSDACMRGHDNKNGRKLEDLEILAELQHYDAATCLFDFTRNPLVALWFACRQSSSNEESTHGKVIALDMGDENLCTHINQPEQLKEKIRDFLLVGKYRKHDKMVCIWVPHHQNKRITAQQSVFVFGKSQIDDYHGKAEIAKDGMNEELEKLGISEDSLFCDFHGFARNNAQNIAYQHSHKDYYEMAELNRINQNYGIALDYYNEALKKPSYKNAYYGRGRTHASMKNYQHAIADYKKAIKHDKKHVYAYYHLAIAQMRIRRIANAIKSLDQAIAKSSDFAKGYFLRGHCQIALGHLADGIHDLDEAIRINPQFAEAFFGRGNAHALLGDHQESIKDYDETIRISPQHVKAFFNRGNSKAELGDHQESIKDYDETIRINPQHVKAFFNRAHAKALLGNHQEAIKDYDESIRLDPQYAKSFFNRALCKYGLGDKHGAWADFQEAQRLDPKMKPSEQIKNPNKDNKK